MISKDILYKLATNNRPTVRDRDKVTAQTPSEKQIEAENYKKLHVNMHGFKISIENPHGSVRSGVSPDGTEWSNRIHSDYGHLLGVKGADGDLMDVFLSPTAGTATKVHVIDQVVVKDGKATKTFDEHKCMIGWDTQEQAKKAYLKNYDKGWAGLGTITTVTMAEFKKWARSPDTKKPYSRHAVKEARMSTVAQLMEKEAFIIPAFGGGDYHVGTGRGLGLDLGYAHALGLLPLPTAGVRAGGKKFGVSAGVVGGLPMLALDTGRAPGWQKNYPRSFWKLLKDKLEDRAVKGDEPKSDKPKSDKDESEEQQKEAKMSTVAQLMEKQSNWLYEPRADKPVLDPQVKDVLKSIEDRAEPGYEDMPPLKDSSREALSKLQKDYGSVSEAVDSYNRHPFFTEPYGLLKRQGPDIFESNQRETTAADEVMRSAEHHMTGNKIQDAMAKLLSEGGNKWTPGSVASAIATYNQEYLGDPSAAGDDIDRAEALMYLENASKLPSDMMGANEEAWGANPKQLSTILNNLMQKESNMSTVQEVMSKEALDAASVIKAIKDKAGDIPGLISSGIGKVKDFAKDRPELAGGLAGAGIGAGVGALASPKDEEGKRNRLRNALLGGLGGAAGGYGLGKYFGREEEAPPEAPEAPEVPQLSGPNRMQIEQALSSGKFSDNPRAWMAARNTLKSMTAAAEERAEAKQVASEELRKNILSGIASVPSIQGRIDQQARDEITTRMGETAKRIREFNESKQPGHGLLSEGIPPQPGGLSLKSLRDSGIPLSALGELGY